MANTPNPYQQLTYDAGGAGALMSGQLGQYTSATDPQMLNDLKTLQQYDPSASVVSNDLTPAGGQTDTTYSLKFDGSKMPQAPAGYTQNFFLDQGLPSSGQSPGSNGTTIRDNYTTANAVNDGALGAITPTADQGTIDEKANEAAELNSGGFFGKLVNAVVPHSPLGMFAEIAGLGGLGSAVSGALGGGLGGAVGGAATQLGLGAAATGGQNLENPMSYLGAAAGIGSSYLPPQLQNILKWANMGYSAIKNPIGTAVNTGLGYLGNAFKGGGS